MSNYKTLDNSTLDNSKLYFFAFWFYLEETFFHKDRIILHFQATPLLWNTITRDFLFYSHCVYMVISPPLSSAFSSQFYREMKIKNRFYLKKILQDSVASNCAQNLLIILIKFWSSLRDPVVSDITEGLWISPILFGMLNLVESNAEIMKKEWRLNQ